MADSHKNFAESLVATAPSPANTGTSLVVTGGEGSLFPTAPFNATVWPAGEQPTAENAEIVRVTTVSTDTLTITRKQEGTRARNIIIGDQIAAAITAQTLLDAETPMMTWSPFIVSSGAATALQTLATATGQSSSGSVFVFPVTVNGNLQFNQIAVPISMSYTTSNAQGSNSYYSYFGLYSMNASTALSLIGSNSFSIAESFNSLSRTLSYPTTTMTSGYGYDSLAMSNTAQIVNYVSGTRWFGLAFGSEMRLTNGIYYVGLLSVRSTGNNSQAGMNVTGVLGQPIDPPHAVGSVSGYLPIGSAASAWGGANAANSTQWWGRHIVGFVTNTVRAGYGGTQIPSAITLSELGASAANLTGTVLPAITFYSNLMT
jgi:hypothetical protein